MSDGSLSQDEIDALLQGGGGGMDFGGGSPQAEKGLDLTPKEKQDIISLLSSVVSSQSSNLSSMVGQPVQMGRPAVEVKGKDDITGDLSDEIVEIKIDYDDGINGEHIFVFPSDVATTIASQMMGQQDVELSDAAVSALEEAGNTLSGSAVTIIGDKIGRTIMTSPGQSRKIMKEELGIGDGNYVKVSYPITIDDAQPSQIVEIFAVPLVKEIVKPLGGKSEAPKQAPPQQAFAAQPAMPQGFAQGGFQQQAAPQMFGGGFMPQANVQSVQFPSLNPQMVGADQGNIGLLMDVYMEMTVELGRTRRLIRDILSMGEGTIIELDKLAGEPVDILVNHKLIAKGEVVVIDENFGVRVTEILSPMDRVGDMS